MLVLSILRDRLVRRLLAIVFALVLPLLSATTSAAQSGAAASRPAAPVGNAEAGKVHWAFGNTSCLNCHGPAGEGAYALPLAGRKLTYEKFRSYVRNPLGRMPAYVESQLTDQEIADIVAYFD